jgi:hypothetical protein
MIKTGIDQMGFDWLLSGVAYLVMTPNRKAEVRVIDGFFQMNRTDDYTVRHRLSVDATSRERLNAHLASFAA